MALKLGVGKSEFDDLLRSGNYYVDKTELIYELVEETDNRVTLFTRPRRFGKTLTMNMLESFFSVQKDSRSIFEGLDILKHKEFCDEWMNKYPVLFITFKDVEDINFDDAYKMLKSEISDVCKRISFLEDKITDYNDRDVFRSLMSKTADKDDIKKSLKIIMRIMRSVYGKQVILLIDEYDVPLARASEYGTGDGSYYRKMLNIMRGIMSTALKDNEYLKFAVITGCLRVAKESVFTGTNNFAAYTALDKRFSNYFGFMQNEVSELLSAAGLDNKAEIIREWYDGYIFGNSSVYCPWDVINYVSNLLYDNEAEPENYWMNTSHNGIILTFAKETRFNVVGKFEKLMNGEAIIQTVADDLTYDTANSTEENLWSILLMTGYLTKASTSGKKDDVELRIPNREIEAIFEKAVVRAFRETIDDSAQKIMAQALWDRDETAASKGISDMLWGTISYHNYSEAYYHAFLAGAFTGMGYETDSDSEMGLGRPDIVVKDHNNRRAIIIEAKKSAKAADMEKDCEDAKKQILERKYAEDDSLYGYERVICCGVAFYKKSALVRMV